MVKNYLRDIIKRKNWNLYVFYIVVTLISLVVSGCDTVKDTLGLTHQSPDEFTMSDAPPLTLPPDYELLPPQQDNVPSQETISSKASGSASASEEKSTKAAKAILQS